MDSLTMRKNGPLVILLALLLATSPLGGFLASPRGWEWSNGAVQAQTGGEWPQLQHDPQRSGYTAEQVSPPFTYLWKWYGVPFAGRTQPVVADGRLLIGGLDGVMYARDAHTGAPLWSYPTGAPIRHSAGVDADRVFFGAHNGSIYALNTTSGALLWRHQAAGSIVVAPLIANNTVYIGSSGGVFYALSTDIGQVRWTYNAGAPILTSAALSEDGRTIYFGAENMYAYALDASNGTLRWRTRLQGQSLADRWPVVSGDLVIYRSQSLVHFHRLLHDGDDVMDQAGPYSGPTMNAAVWAADWQQVRPQIVQHLINTPNQQTFFALDPMTGNIRDVAPVLYTYGNGDAPAPPVSRNGALYTVYRSRHGIQTDSGSVHVTSSYDAELGQMNPATLDITGLVPAPDQNWNVHFRATSDEPSALSIGGSMLFVDNWERLGGIDVESGQLFEVANVAADWPECSVQCEARDGPMPFFSSYPFPGPRVGEGRQRSGAIIAEGAIYWRVIEGGLAAIGHSSTARQTETFNWFGSSDDTDEFLSAAAGTAPSASITSPPPLASYVWSSVRQLQSQPAPDLVTHLEHAVQSMVDAGHLAPFYLERGFSAREAIPGESTLPQDGLCRFSPGNVYWFDPGELIYTLSLAYPYLSVELQNRVRTYLIAEMHNYPPLSPLPYPGSSTWLVDGVRREPYPVTIVPNNWPPPSPPLSTLYALWTYANATGDWTYLETHWPQIDQLFDTYRNQVDSYARIAGAIAYARIADRLGHIQAAQEGEQVAVAAMTAGTNLSTFLTAANNRYPDARPDSYNGTRAPVFFGLVPEVGAYLRDYAGQDVRTYLEEFTNPKSGNLVWYLTRAGVQIEPGESSFHGPELAWSIFMAYAYTQEFDNTQLHAYLDRPWGLGDLYYIQKLVATIEASNAPNMSYSTKTASSTVVRAGEVVTYTIDLINSGALLTQPITISDCIPHGMVYQAGSATATLGELFYSNGCIHWSGVLSDTPQVVIHYAATITETTTRAIRNMVTINSSMGILERSAIIMANPHRQYLPLCLRQ